MSVWMFICALIGTTYGAADFFPGKSALYLKMVTCGVGCQMFSRLFYVVYIMTQGSTPDGFHIGFLGMAGSFLFFLSANYGQMDTLVDDGTAAFRKTRLEALLVPCVLLAIYVLFFQQARDMESRISVGFMALLLLLALFVLEKRERLVVGYILAGATVCILLSKANTVLYRALGQNMLYFGDYGIAHYGGDRKGFACTCFCFSDIE